MIRYLDALDLSGSGRQLNWMYVLTMALRVFCRIGRSRIADSGCTTSRMFLSPPIAPSPDAEGCDLIALAPGGRPLFPRSAFRVDSLSVCWDDSSSWSNMSSIDLLRPKFPKEVITVGMKFSKVLAAFHTLAHFQAALNHLEIHNVLNLLMNNKMPFCTYSSSMKNIM